jgi:hypothetical protein
MEPKMSSSVKYWITEVEDLTRYINNLKHKNNYGNYCVTRNITHEDDKIIVDDIYAMHLSNECIRLIIAQLEKELETARAEYKKAILKEAEAFK